MLTFTADNLRIVRANRAACDLYGWSAGELEAMTLVDIRPPSEAAPFLEWLASGRTVGPLLNPGSTHHFGLWKHWRADGSIVHVEVTSAPIVVDGQALRVSFIRDQTARVLAEAERNRSVHRLMELQEELHHEIAERLHDGPVQTLTAASLRLGLLRRTADDVTAIKIEAIERLVIDALQALRREMDEQRAPGEIAADFAGSISSIVNRYGLQHHVAVRSVGADPPPAIAALLYRVAQRVLSECELDAEVDDPWVIDITVDDAIATLRVPVHERMTVEQHLVDWTQPMQGQVHRLVPGGAGAHAIVVSIPIDPGLPAPTPDEGDAG